MDVEKELFNLCKEINEENRSIVVRRISKTVFIVLDDIDGKEAYFKDVEILSSDNIKFSLDLGFHNNYAGMPSPTIFKDEVLPRKLFIKLAAYVMVSYGSIFKILSKVRAMNQFFI